MTPVFTRIDFDLTQWDEALESFGDRTIFQTPAWLSFVARTQNAEPVMAALKDRGQTLGYFTGLIVRKFGLKILGSPFPGWSTDYMGMNLSSGVARRDAVEVLVRFAFSELRCVHVEIMDRKLRVEDLSGLDFRYRMYRSFEADLTQSEEQLFANMTSACRRNIRKAHKCGVSIEEAQDIGFANDYYAQLLDVFAKQSLAPTYDVERVRQLITHLYPTGRLLLLRARDPNGRCIATGIFPCMNGSMHFWGGASWREYQFMRPNEAIHWYAMRYAKHRGFRVYDMGGGGEYKRKYGVHEIRVPWFRKSKYPWVSHMRDVAKQVHYLGQQCLGKLTQSVRQIS